LRLYLSGESPLDVVPVLRMLTAALPDLESRAIALANRLRAVPGLAEVQTEASTAYAGGGALPDQAVPSWQVRLKIEEQGDAEFARRLRLGTPAVLARVRDGWVCLDLRTIFPEQEDGVIAAVQGALNQSRP
jgi:L-seryl-tRNA(Ser) seleniumtransferase